MLGAWLTYLVILDLSVTLRGWVVCAILSVLLWVERHWTKNATNDCRKVVQAHVQRKSYFRLFDRAVASSPIARCSITSLSFPSTVSSHVAVSSMKPYHLTVQLSYMEIDETIKTTFAQWYLCRRDKGATTSKKASTAGDEPFRFSMICTTCALFEQQEYCIHMIHVRSADTSVRR